MLKGSKGIDCSTVDSYIASFPELTQQRLREMREIIRSVIPDASETISYEMPAYRNGKVIVYFGGFKSHVALFPTPSGVAAFQSELTAYKTSKGTIRFSLSEPLPENLIKKIVAFRRDEVN
jgi:uncharacterized protein YdhG (YjbR/CyaY superfamily)